ncbi:LPS export ABC transporter periplasmic protein LptC [Alteraurantiacibacter aquimixticola]|uniref:LPS export ABC transporter periplasmic protein LptC n=1 Tax=Alteraurantiacibacter aquimixticola TaxID=2489173 RepID=A0A4V4U893_9SPHN|nr:LPS export ABC transporter periplasmic protein LptC [Alteraurantiacibacter aquimixticola]TIX48957.1 LPS export ABC transporter periplasmic protein LptC [Alteraurantiacibacter aquimixticola]
MTAQADQIRNRRQAFAAPGSPLDRIVRVLAVGLPAAVGVVAAMMLITPLSPTAEISFLLDRNKVEITDTRLRVDNAMYRGEDSRGRPFSIAAGDALQSSDSVPIVEMHELVARIVLPEGPAVLSSATGTYNIDEEQVAIPGMVEFTAADGYRMTARNVQIDLPTRTIHSNGPVEGTVPAGSFSADQLHADLHERTLSLDGNAKLRMVPARLRMPAGVQ